MNLPTNLTDMQSGRQIVNRFAGLDKRAKIPEGTWADELNISTKDYPLFSSRGPRGKYELHFPEGMETDGLITSFIHNNMWFFIKGNKLYAERLSGDNVVLVADDEFSKNAYLVTMGAYVIVFPDGFYVNSANVNTDSDVISFPEQGYINTAFSGNCNYWRCNERGEMLDDIISETMPKENVKNGTRWFDNANNVLSIWSEAQEMWVQQKAEYYFAICRNGIADMFVPGDSIYVSTAENALPAQIKYEHLYEGNRYVYDVHHAAGETDIEDKYPIDVDTDFIILVTDTYIDKQKLDPDIINGLKLMFQRKVPAMDYVFECNNRLWGCYFGPNEKGEMLNEIYASKLGDFKNWYCYQGVSTDSYTASVGAQGPFTGGIAYNGYPTFFKENTVYKVYGMYPAQYQISTESIAGVALGCGKSLCIINDVLYYQGRYGIYAYNGQVPTKISDALGVEQEHTGIDDVILGVQSKPDSTSKIILLSALILLKAGISQGQGSLAAVDSLLGVVSGTVNGNLYIDKLCKVDTVADNLTFRYERFVYDTSTNIWHKEDSRKAVQTYNLNGTCYYLDEDDTTGFDSYRAYMYDVPTEDKIDWYAVSGPIGTDDPDRKYISRIDIRTSMTPNSRLMIHIRYDSSGDWRHVATISRNNTNAFSLPVKLRRCDHYELKLSGTGDVKIHAITKTIETGSDL